MSEAVIPSSARGPAAALASIPVMVGRCVRLTRRNLDALITALVLPIMLMLLFVYLFGGAIATGGKCASSSTSTWIPLASAGPDASRAASVRTAFRSPGASSCASATSWHAKFGR